MKRERMRQALSVKLIDRDPSLLNKTLAQQQHLLLPTDPLSLSYFMYTTALRTLLMHKTDEESPRFALRRNKWPLPKTLAILTHKVQFRRHRLE